MFYFWNCVGVFFDGEWSVKTFSRSFHRYTWIIITLRYHNGFDDDDDGDDDDGDDDDDDSQKNVYSK